MMQEYFHLPLSIWIITRSQQDKHYSSEYILSSTYTSERSESRTATEQSSLMEASKGELEDRDETAVRTIKSRKLLGDKLVKSAFLSEPDPGTVN